MPLKVGDGQMYPLSFDLKTEPCMDTLPCNFIILWNYIKIWQQ